MLRNFALRSKLDEICRISSEIWFSDDELQNKAAVRFCHDWELAIIVFITKKVRTL